MCYISNPEAARVVQKHDTTTPGRVPRRQMASIAFPLETEALVVEAAGGGFKRQPVVVKDMRPDEVLVEMLYTGICHTVSPLETLSRPCPAQFPGGISQSRRSAHRTRRISWESVGCFLR